MGEQAEVTKLCCMRGERGRGDRNFREGESWIGRGSLRRLVEKFLSGEGEGECTRVPYDMFTYLNESQHFFY